MNIDLIEVLWEGTKIDGSCWIWTGAKRKGYGNILYNGDTWVTSRLSLSIYLKIPYKGEWVACHICNNKDCWNPTHLYVGTPQENVLECKDSPAYINSIKAYCPKGHAYDRGNKRQRYCTTCKREATRRSREKLNAIDSGSARNI